MKQVRMLNAPRPRRIVAAVMLSALPFTATAAAPSASRAAVQAAAQYRVYVGTYTRGGSKGIYHFQLEMATGRLTPIGATGGIENPSFLAVHPNRKFLYAVSEVGRSGGKSGGAVTSFSVDAATGQLTQLNQQPSQGTGPCHLVVDRTGKNVIVVNYSSGSVTVVPLGDDGRLRPPSCSIQHEGSSVDPARQKGPHAHSVNLDAGNRFAFVADLGLDKVLIYRFDAEKGLLEANRPPFASLAPGAGPRHFAFHPNGRFAYVINEMQSTVTAFRFNLQSGELTTMQSVSALPTGYQGKSWTAEVQVHPSGKFLYGSNRGHDSIAIFGVDPETGMLTAKGHEPTQGKTPRNFALDPTGTFLLAENQESGTIVVFRIDAQTGLLTATGQKVEVPSPVCVKMIPLP